MTIMSETARRSTTPGRACRRLLLVAMTLGTGSAAAETPGGTSVPGVRAGSTCLKEQVRITGFAMPRDEGGASIPLDGYRITEILVAEGDRVTSNQELIRAVRPGGDDAAPANPALPRPTGPASYTLRAPMAGKVTRINARVGMMTGAASGQMSAAMQGAGIQGAGLQQPEPQIRIADDSGIDLLVDVPSPYVTKIRAGLAARVLLDDGTELKGVVRVPVSEVDPGTQLGRARLAIDPPTGLRTGQFASALVETARDCGLTVPRSAVTYQNGAASVQVFRGTAVETRSVRTGLFDESTIQIREGLAEGEPVVATAGTVFRPGDRVSPVITGRKDGAK